MSLRDRRVKTDASKGGAPNHAPRCHALKRRRLGLLSSGSGEQVRRVNTADEIDPEQATWYSASLKVLGLFGTSICILFAFIWWNPACRTERAFNRLEAEMKKVTSGAELHSWATNLLAQYPTNASVSVSNLGKDFPKELLGVAPRMGPRVSVHHDAKTPHYVLLYWGSGVLGAKMFEIGPTNLESSRGGTAWGAPGVYFVDRTPRRSSR